MKMDILTIAEQNQRAAWKIVEDTGIVPEWERIGGEVHIVGSLKSGLMMKNRDIDMHIYTDKVDVAESFSVVKKLAENPAVKEIQYKNLLDTEEECLEWHVWYEDTALCKLDMIHIRRGSRYDGVVERVTEEIISRLTPELKRTILQIKTDVPEGISVPGIEIYHAVFTGGVRSYAELEQWRRTHPLRHSLEWRP